MASDLPDSYSHDDAHDEEYGQPIDVPLKTANEDTLREYGRIVRDFEAEEVWIQPWPALGRRPLAEGTGNRGGVRSGPFCNKWEGDQVKAANDAVGYDFYVTGRLPADVSPTNRTHVLVKNANYHPDGGQVFYPKDGAAFVALLALPGDDVKPEDFVAFYFDGSFGLQIKASIWHQPMYPMDDKAEFLGKQGAVYACIEFDSVDEFGKYMRVPLKPDLAR